jgi:hypothetical protein
MWGIKIQIFFHCQAKAWVWRNKIIEIRGEDNFLISGQDQLRQATKNHYENLYTEYGKGDIDAQENFLNYIPRLITDEDNIKLSRKVTKK